LAYPDRRCEEFAGRCGKFRFRPARDVDFLTKDRFSIGIRLAPRWSVRIKHTATVLLLMTMAAAPVTGIACVGWCFGAETPTSTVCHHATAMLAIGSADENCDNVLAVSPFIREETRQVQAVLPASTPPWFLTSAAGEAPLAFGAEINRSMADPSTSALVLRL
jgi:hypothetical protein